MKNNNPKQFELTASVEEGPYYKPGSPERTSIAEPGTPGHRLILEGKVTDATGNPVPHAWLDFWHADGRGEYDNENFNLRGHQFADAEGHYRLETVRPYEYLFRTAHIHAKVRATENSPVLTTQLFFPDEKRNESDPLFEGATVMDVTDIEDGQQARFDFVVER